MTYKHLPSPHGRETVEGDATAHKADVPPVFTYIHVEIGNIMTLSLTSHHSSPPQIHIIDDSTFENYTFQCLHYRPTLHAKILYTKHTSIPIPIQILASTFSFVKSTLQSRRSSNTKNGLSEGILPSVYRYHGTAHLSFSGARGRGGQKVCIY